MLVVEVIVAHEYGLALLAQCAGNGCTGNPKTENERCH
jgi:hypothetical protein